MIPLLAPIVQLLFTVYYFFYFLAKGNPEWKCHKEKDGETMAETARVCCDRGEGQSMSTQYSQRGIRVWINAIPSKIRHYWRRLMEWLRRGSQAITSHFSVHRLKEGLKRIGAYGVSLLRSSWQIISTFVSTLFSFLLFRRVPSKTMPTSEVIYSSQGKRDANSIAPSPIASTPVPYTPSPSSPPPPPPPPPPRPTRVPSSHKEEETTIDKEECVAKKEGSFKEGAFYSTRVYATNQEDERRATSECGVKTLPSARDTVRGGIPVFPPSMMAEIAGSGGNVEGTRSEVNRTPNPTVKERLRDASLTPTHKSPVTFEYSNTTTHPYSRNDEIDQTSSKYRVDVPKGWTSNNEDRRIRAKSAGPPRVSRIEDSSNNEAQFIFRPHGSEETIGYNNVMGRSAHFPMTETEGLRYNMARPMDSRATTPSIWSCNTSRVSTPAPNTRATRGRVGDTARSWPPPPNAQGADIGKECFVDGDGIVTTACTRIVEKRNEESWRWLDDNGHVIDEKKQFSLMGNKDELHRDGPFQANHYSQHYFVDRDGLTKFENTHRQYDRDFVVESVCRNY